MLTALITLHIVVCVLLTVIVLVQFGKGAEAGAMMGGGASQAVFTSSAKGNFFTKLTTVLAIVFMANSIILTTIKSKTSRDSIFDDEAPVAAPLNSDPTAIQTPQPVESKPGEVDVKANAEKAAPEATKETSAKATDGISSPKADE